MTTIVFRILLLEDDEEIAQSLQEFLLMENMECRQVGALHEAQTLLAQEQFHVILADVHLPDGSSIDAFVQLKEIAPRSEFVLMTSFATVRDSVNAMRQGVFMYIEKDSNIENLLLIVHRAAEKAESQFLIHKLTQRGSQAEIAFDKIIGHSEALVRCKEKAQRASLTELPVLLAGETGTGKEVFARAIHAGSKRASRSLVSINCSALPFELFESELFGYRKGAFSHALHDKKGLFEEAHTSTLFLDEIGELPLLLQPKLLRVLESKEFRRLGTNELLQSDFRLITATNRHLHTEVEKQTFRSDLLFRIEGITIHIPPLRQRPEDITLLAKYFLVQANTLFGKDVQGVTSSLRTALQEYPWYGNVRELKAVIERMVAFSDLRELNEPMFRDVIHDNLQGRSRNSFSPQATAHHADISKTVSSLPYDVQADLISGLPLSKENTSLSSSQIMQRDSLPMNMTMPAAKRQTEYDVLLSTLEQYQWHLGKTAEALGIDYSTLYRKMKKFGISKKTYHR